MSDAKKISTEGGQSLGHNPFGVLSGAGLPLAPKSVLAQAANVAGNTGRLGAAAPTTQTKYRGRVDIRRETGNRGGKIVTVIDGFVGIGLPEKEALAKKIRSACGCGGTVKAGAIEIQGDQREKIAAILSEAGFRPVFAGG